MRPTSGRTFGVVLAIVCGASAAVARAQEGHPLVGTWHGTWGPTATERHDVTVVLEFDGKAVTGMLNPGPDSVRFDKVTLDPGNWSVHFEATPKGTNAMPIVIDATIQDVTNRRRSLVGTWTQGSMKSDFKVTRDD
ncbi:MAG: hypothetical protein AUH43_19680 [Acidobacteria bacterium 13_1_40CM_65_14]|jgi:hypothetical protein|nr:MAG: hypothetical protein AUH43_19680 [Acidobacteria bacterium 13_1_40CM_65_14]